MASRPETVCVWLDEDQRVCVHEDYTENGDPCLLIPADRDSIFAWVRGLLLLLDGTTDQEDLPGRFSVINNDNL